MDLDHLLLVLSNEVAIIAFIETPALVDGDPLQTHLHEGHVGGSNRSAEKGSVHLIELDATLLQHLTSQPSLKDTILSEGRISPSYKSIVAIPRALTMSEEYHIVMSILIDRGEVGAPMGTQTNALFGISLDGLVVAVVAAR